MRRAFFGLCLEETALLNVFFLFPDDMMATFRKVLDFLPFRAVYDIPLTILLKKNGADTPEGLLQMLALQLGWCIILTVAGNLFWNHAVKQITVNGG